LNHNSSIKGRKEKKREERKKQKKEKSKIAAFFMFFWRGKGKHIKFLLEYQKSTGLKRKQV
jgi:hypothetical protein